jgi:hypothetical protein
VLARRRELEILLGTFTVVVISVKVIGKAVSFLYN